MPKICRKEDYKLGVILLKTNSTVCSLIKEGPYLGTDSLITVKKTSVYTARKLILLGKEGKNMLRVVQICGEHILFMENSQIRRSESFNTFLRKR